MKDIVSDLLYVLKEEWFHPDSEAAPTPPIQLKKSPFLQWSRIFYAKHFQTECIKKV